jgi:hypothetical protein
VSAAKPYRLKLSSCGNPDFGQYAPLSPKVTLFCDSITECIDAAQEYRDKHQLGGGNWDGGEVFQGSKMVGRISYNGRYWPVKLDEGTMEMVWPLLKKLTMMKARKELPPVTMQSLDLELDLLMRAWAEAREPKKDADQN